MKRALVAIDDVDVSRALLREAGQLAAGVDAELVLLSALTPEEYANSVETIQTIENIEHTSFDKKREAVLESAERYAEEIAKEEFGDLDVDYRAVGVVVAEGGRADEIIENAEKYNCDHIFVAGRKRSPTGKAIFGDVAQAVILNFDGLVTVATE